MELPGAGPVPSPGHLPKPGIEPRSPILQADSLPAEPQGSPRTLECVAYPFSSGPSGPRSRTGVSCIAGGFFNNWAIGEPVNPGDGPLFPSCLEHPVENTMLVV